MKDDTQLARWLAGEMEETELKAFEARPDYADFLRIKVNFERIQKPQFDADKMLEQVLQHEKVSVKTIPLYRKRWLQVAALLVLLLSVGIGYILPEHPEAANGQHYAFMLPDQSEVILNAGSKATYSGWNWSNKRLITLEGEAYFKVAKGKTFSVTTNLGTVQVVGTQFNVKARDNRLDVVCYEGKVRVQFQTEKILLIPGQSISFGGAAGDQVIPVKVNAPGWLHHELVFSKEQLPAIIAEVERQYNVKISLTGGSAQLFTGSLPGNDIDAVLKILSLTFHLKAVKAGETITLSPVDAE